MACATSAHWSCGTSSVTLHHPSAKPDATAVPRHREAGRQRRENSGRRVRWGFEPATKGKSIVIVACDCARAVVATPTKAIPSATAAIHLSGRLSSGPVCSGPCSVLSCASHRADAVNTRLKPCATRWRANAYRPCHAEAVDGSEGGPPTDANCATMCYMSSTHAARRSRPAASDRVGVRELRQNFSVYLARVVAGERLQVTDRGLPVALLIPLPPSATLVEQLVAAGRAVPPSRALGTLPPLKGKVAAGMGARLQKALQDSREDRL